MHETNGGWDINLNSILIGLEDPRRLADYYTNLFGEPGGTRAATSAGRWARVGHDWAHDEVQGKNTQPGWLKWNIETRDVKAEFDRLVAAGAIVIQEPYKPERRGRRLDLHARRSRRQLLPVS
jgi:hypothetical protein